MLSFDFGFILVGYYYYIHTCLRCCKIAVAMLYSSDGSAGGKRGPSADAGVQSIFAFEFFAPCFRTFEHRMVYLALRTAHKWVAWSEEW